MRGFSIVVAMAFRNVLKYWKRSLGTFVVVFVGISAISLADAFMNGFADRLVAGYAVAGGHMRVSSPGYAARRATCPLDRVVAEPEALASAASAVAGRFRVAAVPILRSACALQLGELSANLYVAGAEAYLDGMLAPPFASSASMTGRYPGPGERGLVLFAKDASRLEASLGDSVVLLANDAFGSFGAVELPILGITRSAPGPETCLVDLASMRELLGIPAGATEVALYLVDGSGAPIDPRLAKDELRAMEAAALGLGLEAELWDASSSSIPAMLAFFDSFILALYVIFVAVAGTGVANSVLLSIQDRTRDFGTLRAVAFSSRWVRAIVALETLFIGAAASTAAAAASWGAIALMGEKGFSIPRATRGIADWMPDAITASIDPASHLLILLAGCLFPLFAAAYPLRRLGKMKIREALSGA